MVHQITRTGNSELNTKTMETINQLRKAQSEGFEFVILNYENDDSIGGLAKTEDECLSVAWEMTDNDQMGRWLYGSSYKIEESWGTPEGFSYQTIDSYIKELETLIDDAE